MTCSATDTLGTRCLFNGRVAGWPSTSEGLTLIELAMVALVLALIAAVAMPTGTNVSTTRVEAAASEVAAAVRFARDESIRTGESYGVRQQNGANRFRVFRLDSGGNVVYDVYHPIAKQLWDYQFDTAPAFPGVTITRAMAWRGSCNVDGNIAFRSDGTPFCTDPVTALLDNGKLALAYDNEIRLVYVDGFTGRVTLQ